MTSHTGRQSMSARLADCDVDPTTMARMMRNSNVESARQYTQAQRGVNVMHGIQTMDDVEAREKRVRRRSERRRSKGRRSGSRSRKRRR